MKKEIKDFKVWNPPPPPPPGDGYKDEDHLSFASSPFSLRPTRAGVCLLLCPYYLIFRYKLKFSLLELLIFMISISAGLLSALHMLSAQKVLTGFAWVPAIYAVAHSYFFFFAWALFQLRNQDYSRIYIILFFLASPNLFWISIGGCFGLFFCAE